MKVSQQLRWGGGLVVDYAASSDIERSLDFTLGARSVKMVLESFKQGRILLNIN